MSDNSNQTSVRQDSNVSDFPIAAIVCLSVGGYVILVMIFLSIRRLLVSKGMLDSSCCCPESLPLCCACDKMDEMCRSCCGSCCQEGCLKTMCGIDKELKCKDIFCCCFTCQRGCDPCRSQCQKCSYCCRHPAGCCSCDCDCPPCFGADLDPNSCGCFCLEIKLRTAHRSSSAPPGEILNQNINADVSLKDGSNLENMYHSTSIAERTLNESKIAGGSARESRQSASHSPTKAATHLHQMLPGNIKGFNASKTEGQNSIRANFNAEMDESLSRHEFQQHLFSSAVLSSSAPGDLFARSSVNKAGTLEIEPNHKSTSRSRRLIRPGQISQRFPNKILVTAESLNFSSLEKTKNVISEVLLISNNEESLPQVAAQYDDVNLHRPLPPLKRTV